MKNQYCIQDKQTGEVLAAGDASKCMKALGICNNAFYSELKRQSHFMVTLLPAPETLSEAKKTLADQWDAFCEPLRKKYGIEVKRWP